MEVQSCDSELMEADSPVVIDDHKLPELIATTSFTFQDWTSLISEIDNAFSDNIERLDLVYDAFLSEFPLCYGYWRKYVNHAIRLCNVDKVVELFERALRFATYCVDLWVDYCSFGSLVFEDPADVRRLFKRGLSYVGKDYLCHALWDKYLEFEFSQRHWSSLAHIYIQALRFPTKKLHRYYDNFKKFVRSLEEETEFHSHSNLEVALEPVPDSEVPKCYKEADISCVIKDLLDSSVGLVWFKALQKYKSAGEQFYKDASELNENINCFESRIRRSYFHILPLDVTQLENWHNYLDFAELHKDFDWAVKLYERCLIPCANYPDFWMRYVEFVERKGGREIAIFALDRATQIFLKRVPAIHLLNARFKECIGDIPNAHVAFTHCDTDSDTGFVENVVMKANMERRLGNVVAASNTFKEAIEKAAAKGKFHILPILYVHGSRLTYVTTNSEDAARDILIDGIKRVPCCKLLIEELIKFAMAHKGSSHINVVDSVVSSAISPSAGVSQGLSVTDGEHISRLYIELVDLCGTARDVRKAWNRHARLFPHSVRTTFCPVTGTKRWKVSKEEKQEVLDTLPSQESGNGMSDCVVQSSMQEKQHLVETPDNQIAHPPTDQAPDQKSPLLESHDMVSDPSTFKPCESGASDDNEKMRVDFISLKDSEEQPGEDDQKPNVYVEMRLDCISLKDSAEQPGEDDPEANVSLDSAHRVTNATEGPQAALEISKENDLQEQSDLEPQQDLKPPSLEGLSLDTQDARSPGPLTPKSYDFEAPQGIGPFPSTSGKCEAIQELSFSSGSIRRNEAYEENSMSCGSLPVSGRHANVDHLISSPSSSQATVSTQINTGSVSPSTSASNVNTMASAPPGPQMFERIGKNWRQRSNPDRIRRDSKFGFRGNSHKRLHQQGQATPRQHFPQAERGSQLPMSQGYSSQPLSSQSPHRQQGSQVHNQYCTPVAHPNITSPQAWSVQNTQQQNLSAVCQSQPTVQPGTFPQAQMSQYPLQSNEQHGTTQNNQVYNQMWQYYYYQQQQQQQLLWQQQQQPQQQQLLQQQYQQQMLQLEYLQQQQLPYQQQQEQLQMLFQQHQQQLLLQQQQLQSQPQQAFHLPQQLLQQQTTQQLQIQQEHLLYLQQQQQQLQQQLQQQHQQMAPTLQKQHEQEQVELEPQINRSQIQGGAASPHDTKPSRTVESCEAPRPHPLGSK